MDKWSWLYGVSAERLSEVLIVSPGGTRAWRDHNPWELSLVRGADKHAYASLP